MALSAAQLVLVDTAITNILTRIAQLTAAQLMDGSDQGRSIGFSSTISALKELLRTLRGMKVQPSMVWLGTDYHTTEAAGINVLPEWINEWAAGVPD
jgi:hypothetical protein